MLKAFVFALAAAGLTAVGITAASSPARAAAAPTTTRTTSAPRPDQRAAARLYCRTDSGTNTTSSPMIHNSV
jgi:hypothetical protein